MNKKSSIGFNIVSSIDGIINARGVKSKPNNIQISGYTHEIGEGEKSPDNPYKLFDLDSGKGNNLYNIDALYKYIINPETGTIRYGMILDAPNSGYYTIKGFNDTYMMSYRIYNTINNTVSNYITMQRWYDYVIPISQDEKLYLYYGEDFGDLSSIKNISKNAPVVVDGKTIQKYEPYFEHSIALSNNNTTIQVPVPIALNSVEGVSDYIFKDSDNIWKLVQNCKKYEFDGNETITSVYSQAKNAFANSNYAVIDSFYNDNPVFAVCTHFTTAKKNYSTAVEFLNSENNYSFSLKKSNANKERLIRFRYDEITSVSNFTDFLSKQHDNDTPVTVVYRLALPIIHTLCDYAQQLLNSFEILNQNKIFTDGYPDLKVSGYIQKKRR